MNPYFNDEIAINRPKTRGRLSVQGNHIVPVISAENTMNDSLLSTPFLSEIGNTPKIWGIKTGSTFVLSDSGKKSKKKSVNVKIVKMPKIKLKPYKKPISDKENKIIHKNIRIPLSTISQNKQNSIKIKEMHEIYEKSQNPKKHTLSRQNGKKNLINLKENSQNRRCKSIETNLLRRKSPCKNILLKNKKCIIKKIPLELNLLFNVR